MSFTAPPRIRVPARARPGETVTIKAMVAHPMESGFRMGPGGVRIPRLIVARFVCTFEDETVVDWRLGPGVAANPFLEFDVVVARSGTFRFRWIEDGGAEAVADARIEVA